MKKLVLANQKGGVGKSAIATQFAYYLFDVLKKRVLLVDLDHQSNMTRAIFTGNLATVSKTVSSRLFLMKIKTIEKSNFVLIPADSSLMNLVNLVEKKNEEMKTHFESFLKSVENKFDFCIFDTNPNPDIRQLLCLLVSDFVLSPIQMSQEAIDGIGRFLNDEGTGIFRIKREMNKKLNLIGILPNLVENNSLHQKIFLEICKEIPHLLIPINSSYAAVKKRLVIQEGQMTGMPIWKIKKRSANNAWAEIQPIFENIFKFIMRTKNEN